MPDFLQTPTESTPEQIVESLVTAAGAKKVEPSGVTSTLTPEPAGEATGKVLKELLAEPNREDESPEVEDESISRAPAPQAMSKLRPQGGVDESVIDSLIHRADDKNEPLDESRE